MLKAYVNYPNPHVMIHANLSCASIQQQQKQDQRVVRIGTLNISEVLKRVEEKKYVFGSQAETNDMWLQVDFNDPAFERAVVEHIRQLLASHYAPLARARVEVHC